MGLCNSFHSKQILKSFSKNYSVIAYLLFQSRAGDLAGNGGRAHR